MAICEAPDHQGFSGSGGRENNQPEFRNESSGDPMELAAHDNEYD